MKIEEFFTWYANVPLEKRFIPLDITHYGIKTLSDVYKRMTQLEDQIRPLRIEQQELLELASKVK